MSPEDFNNDFQVSEVPYEFKPANLVPNVLSVIRLFRSGEGNPPLFLQYAGAITGEVGVLLQGQTIALENVVCSEEEMFAKLDELQVVASGAEPNFDITPYLPYILMFIEWIMKRRQG